MINIAINGFGRIGRAAFKVAQQYKQINIVAINDLMDPATLAHLLKYDTAYGTFPAKISSTSKGLKVNGKLIPVYSEKDPASLPWKEHNVDVVLECTGFFTDKDKASGHLSAGARKVAISAPTKDEATTTVVLGTNSTSKKLSNKKTDAVVANASCTTNCISPVMQVLQDAFGVEKALMTTVHSYTSTQNLVDGPNKDLRRARAAAQNIIPTSTGAAIATTQVIPQLVDKFDGIALRVPTITVSLSDITVIVKRKNVSPEQINAAFKDAVKKKEFKNILAVSGEPLVSSDYIGNPYSAIVDLEFTRVVGGDMVKVLAWYDNEWGYSNRLVELAMSLAKTK